MKVSCMSRFLQALRIQCCSKVMVVLLLAEAIELGSARFLPWHLGVTGFVYPQVLNAFATCLIWSWMPALDADSFCGSCVWFCLIAAVARDSLQSNKILLWHLQLCVWNKWMRETDVQWSSALFNFVSRVSDAIQPEASFVTVCWRSIQGVCASCIFSWYKFDPLLFPKVLFCIPTLFNSMLIGLLWW